MSVERNETDGNDGTATATATSRGGKYLTFVLGDEEYGIEILKVREIMGVIGVTAIPQAPDYVKGIINLRGRVIPIIDLRLKFVMPPRDYDKETCFIVVDVKDRLIGIAVDTVSEVLDINEGDIDDSPSFGGTLDTKFILGIGKIKEKVVILLNVEKVLSIDEFEALNQLEE